jgi:hypothetical protein
MSFMRGWPLAFILGLVVAGSASAQTDTPLATAVGGWADLMQQGP